MKRDAMVSSAGRTDIGRVRKNNEDSFLADGTLSLFAVADGIGGHAGGEVASRIAVETLRESVLELSTGRETIDAAAAGILERAFNAANVRVLSEGLQNPELAGMGTTLTALWMAPSGAHLAHVGDSRAYRFRAGTLEQLSSDHSVVGEQMRAGLITPEQAKRSPYRHIITQALGTTESISVDLRKLDVLPSDLFLLCSDGLTEMLDDREITAILAKRASGVAIDEIAELLVGAANEKGGVDNTTVVVIAVEGK